MVTLGALQGLSRQQLEADYLALQEDAQRADAAANLHALLAAHQTPDGVLLGSAAWLITARRAR